MTAIITILAVLLLVSNVAWLAAWRRVRGQRDRWASQCRAVADNCDIAREQLREIRRDIGGARADRIIEEAA